MKWLWLIIGTVTSASSACLSVPGCPAVGADMFALSPRFLTAENSLEWERHIVTTLRKTWGKNSAILNIHIGSQEVLWSLSLDILNTCFCPCIQWWRRRWWCRWVRCRLPQWSLSSTFGPNGRSHQKNLRTVKADYRRLTSLTESLIIIHLNSEAGRPFLKYQLTCGVCGASREPRIMARGEICSHRQLHHIWERTITHVVGCRNLHQVNVAWLQVLQ